MNGSTTQQLAWKQKLDTDRLRLPAQSRQVGTPTSADPPEDELPPKAAANEASRQAALARLTADRAKAKQEAENILALLLYIVPVGIMGFKDLMDILIELLGFGTGFIVTILDALLGFLIQASGFVIYNLADKLTGGGRLERRFVRGAKSFLTGAVEAIPILGLLPIQTIAAIAEVMYKLKNVSAAQAKLRRIDADIKRIKES